MKNAPYPVDLSVMQAALKDHRRGLGKETEQRHYVNEVRLINFAATGNSHSCYRNLPITRELTRAIRLVVCLNIKLIKLDVPYPDRKKSCRDLFLKAISVASQN
jgi:hypothetical protein